MERLVHNTTDVDRVLVLFERMYGVSSEEFYALHVADEAIDMPRFHRHVWASMYRDFLRLGSPNGRFATRAQRTLALA